MKTIYMPTVAVVLSVCKRLLIPSTLLLGLTDLFGATRSPASPALCWDEFCVDNLELHWAGRSSPTFGCWGCSYSASGILRSKGGTFRDPIVRFTEVDTQGRYIGECAQQVIGTVAPGQRLGFTVTVDADAAALSNISLRVESQNGTIDRTLAFGPVFFSKKDAKKYALQPKKSN